MKIQVNGAWREVTATQLARALEELGYGASVVTHRAERRFRRGAARASAPRSPRATGSKCWRRCRGAECSSSMAPRCSSRLLLGTARYPSPAVLTAAVRAAGCEVVTVALRRESAGERAGQGFWSLIRELGVRVLPNTAGCHSVKEAVTTAHMAREVFGTPLDQARSHRRRRYAAAGRVRAHRGGAHPVRGRLRGVSLHHRGPGRGRATAAGGLPGADALGGADRLRPRTEQPVRTAVRCARTSRRCR